MTLSPYEYAVVRLVPRADREEFVNVGVALYSQARDFLAVDVHVDEPRWQALDPALDAALIQEQLRALQETCAGTHRAGSAAGEPPRVRFGWVTAPRSTMVRCGPVHGGLTDDPSATLASLMNRLVR